MRLVWAAGAGLAEGAAWDDRAGGLWWVDIRGRRSHRMDEVGVDRRSWDLPQEPGCLALAEEPARIILGLRAGVFFNPEAGRLGLLAVPEGHSADDHRLNDGKVEPSGRLWFGTMHVGERPAEGALYVLDRSGRMLRAEGPYTVPNGPAFSPDGRVMYCADSPARVIYSFQLGEGGIVREREFVRFAEHEGYPDGMTVTPRAVSGWPTGVAVASPASPATGGAWAGSGWAENVTSCAFGGAYMRTLFITTAGGSGVPGVGIAGGVVAALAPVAGMASGRVRGWT